METTSLLLFLGGLMVFYLLGTYSIRYLEKKKGVSFDNLDTVEGSLLALFAFFLGFTFSISASKLETIRASSIAESNAIGTTLLRTQLYEDSVQMHFKSLFKDYLQSRIEYFKPENDGESFQNQYKVSIEKGEKIWEYATKLQKTDQYVEESRLMLPALNEMIDSVSTRHSDILAKLPNSIIYTLYILSFCSTFIVGFSSKKKYMNQYIGLIYIIIVALTVNLIIDAGDPRSGFINTHKANEYIQEIYNELEHS